MYRPSLAAFLSVAGLLLLQSSVSAQVCTTCPLQRNTSSYTPVSTPASYPSASSISSFTPASSYHPGLGSISSGSYVVAPSFPSMPLGAQPTTIGNYGGTPVHYGVTTAPAHSPLTSNGYASGYVTGAAPAHYAPTQYAPSYAPAVPAAPTSAPTSYCPNCRVR